MGRTWGMAESAFGASGTGVSKEERLEGGEAQDDREDRRNGVKSKEKKKVAVAGVCGSC